MRVQSGTRSGAGAERNSGNVQETAHVANAIEDNHEGHQDQPHKDHRVKRESEDANRILSGASGNSDIVVRGQEPKQHRQHKDIQNCA